MNNINFNIKQISWLSLLALILFATVNLDLFYRVSINQEINPAIFKNVKNTNYIFYSVSFFACIFYLIKEELDFKFWFGLLVLAFLSNNYIFSLSEYLFSNILSKNISSFGLHVIITICFSISIFFKYSKEKVLVLLLSIIITLFGILFNYANNSIQNVANNYFTDSKTSSKSLALIIQASNENFKTICRDFKFTCLLGSKKSKETEKIGNDDVEERIPYILDSIKTQEGKLLSSIGDNHEYNTYTGLVFQDTNGDYRILFNSDANQKVIKAWGVTSGMISLFVNSLLVCGIMFIIGMPHNGAFLNKRLKFKKEQKNF